MDLEAPGMPYKFRAAGMDVPIPMKAGIVDTLHDYVVVGERPATLPIVELWKSPLSSGSVHLYAAGSAPDRSYWKKLSEMNFHSLARDEEQIGVQVFFELYERMREEFAPDIVLIDSRTGVSDIAGAAVQVLAQQAFCLMLDEDEHYEGIRSVMRGMAKCQRPDGKGLIKLVPVLSRVHIHPGTIEEQRTQARALRETVQRRLNDTASGSEDALAIDAADVLLLHNDDNVYRTGRVLLDDLLRGGKDHSSRLVADYYDVGIGRGFLDTEDILRVMARLFPAESITSHSTPGNS
jgi:hypothetical protein